jgi:radical SAM superfamily enzyme YgiQ (UPF0313 family)
MRAFGFFPPLGLEYVASAIEDIVETVKIIDLRFENRPVTAFIDEKTDLALISYNWDVENDFAEETIRSIPGHITVVVGGRYATENANELLEAVSTIDGIARGDGEELARELVQKGISHDIDGLSFRENGRIVHNQNRILSAPKNDFYPNRKIRRYKYMVGRDGVRSDVQVDLMLGSRGCPFNCKFCDSKFNPLGEKRKWAARTPESVVSELKTIEAGVVAFTDDIFTANMDWVDRLCDLLIEEGIKKKYVINTRLEVAKRPDVLKKMYQAGFMGFLIGVESAQDKTLASMDKGFDRAKIREYFRVLRKFHFFYHCYFIIGNIGESREEIMEIAPFAHEIGADTLGLSILKASKYSQLKEMLKGYHDYHIDKVSGKIYSDRLSLEELNQIRRDIHASFYNFSVISRILKKGVLNRVLTLRRVLNIFRLIVKKKIEKRAKKRAVLLGHAAKCPTFVGMQDVHK